ncbi:hypothetical protein IKS57_03455 [bacterium]|nr:hypothetical protein [bacterium]
MKSIFNYDYKMFYLLFISLYMNTHDETEINFLNIKEVKNIKEIMLHIYYHSESVYEDVFFKLEQENALKIQMQFIEIIKTFYKELLDRHLAENLFNAFFENLNR